MRFNGYVWREDNKTEILQGIQAGTVDVAVDFVRKVCYRQTEKGEEAKGVGFMVNVVRWRFLENTVHIEFQGKNLTNIIKSKKELDEFLASRRLTLNNS